MIASTFEQRKNDLRVQMAEALKAENGDSFSQAFTDLASVIADETRENYRQELEAMKASVDSSILAGRGVRQLTSDETAFYQRFTEVAKSDNPKQALTGGLVTMPHTIVESVFEDLAGNHPLLSKINFIPTSANVHLIMNSGTETAVWGELCDDIVKEITSAFTEVDTNLLKLSAFIPVCKGMLDLGPEWIDRFVRAILTEAYARGLEAGIVDGDGNKAPIGMTRQVGSAVSVVGGVYPQKSATAVTSLDAKTVGGLLATMAVDANTGATREIRDVILVCNPADYYSKVMPATTIMAPDGSYRQTLPFNIDIIQSTGCPTGKAILGLAYRYFAAAGSEGKIEFSDHAMFVQDKRVYIVKGYAVGQPKDNNAFQLLNIANLKTPVYKVEQVSASAT